MANTVPSGDGHHDHGDDATRRDFLMLLAGGGAAVGAAALAWPLIDSMNPAADVLALSSTEVNISQIEAGQSVTITWRGKPVFIRHRTEKEIEEARAVNVADLPDPQPDADRVEKPEWLVVVGVCTHLGCVPLGYQGDYDGWFCPCHGSHYDMSGRIRPRPLNCQFSRHYV